MAKNILLIITGSIAAYKSMDLIRQLGKKSYNVTCILTKAAQEFVTPLLASSLSGNKSYDQLFSDDDPTGIDHIKLSRENDLIIIAPATADFIAKIANGYANDLASNVVLACDKKIMIAPAMNQQMWHNKATQENLDKITKIGITTINPESDILACGEEGIGKMAEITKISDKIEQFFNNQNLLKGKNILLTGGSTIEKIDPVRFIGNHSSGKQAIAIANACHEAGAKVTFIAGNINSNIDLILPKNQIINVKSAEEMLKAVENNLKTQDIFIGCAAVADFKVKNSQNHKIKKQNSQNLTLNLEANPDILHFVGHNQNRPKIVIGFAAESQNLAENAQEKLSKKNCDLIIANDIEQGQIFGSNQTKVMLVTKDDINDCGTISKDELAQILVNKIAT